mmetsp:Transcript_12780/g.26913  ORF Transcript_12780/g.26913 Transcript_12780/m.26913 type:complete len:164 (+) Transcript_12780:105-596(+)
MANRYQELATEEEYSTREDNRIITSKAYITDSAYSVDGMSSDTRYKPPVKVEDFVAKADLKPITDNVTSIDVDSFRETIAQAPGQIKSRYTNAIAVYGGYSFRVELELGYQLRVRDLLWASGGKLELSECGYHVVYYDFSPKGNAYMRVLTSKQIIIPDASGN